jgi:hypothetical protein
MSQLIKRIIIKSPLIPLCLPSVGKRYQRGKPYLLHLAKGGRVGFVPIFKCSKQINV